MSLSEPFFVNNRYQPSLPPSLPSPSPPFFGVNTVFNKHVQSISITEAPGGPGRVLLIKSCLKSYLNYNAGRALVSARASALSVENSACILIAHYALTQSV